MRVLTGGVNYRNYLTSFVCGLGYVLYIYKQTFSATPFGLTVTGGAAIFFGIALAINYEYIYSNMQIFWREIILLLFSILLSGVLFHESMFVLTIIAKAALIYLVAQVAVRNNGHALFVMADLSVLFLVLIGVLSEMGMIHTQVGDNGIWLKNYLGFTNPNIAPYFGFAALFVYFVMGAKIRFIGLAILMFLMGWYWLSVFSRTYYIGGVLLLVYVSLASNERWRTHCFNVMRLFVCIVTILYVAIALFVIFNFSTHLMWLSFLDNLLSARILKLSELNFIVADAGPLLLAQPFDNVYYELFFYFGPYGLYLWLKKCRSVLIESAPCESADVWSYGMYVIMLIGLFEGVFMKFSPMLVVIAMIFFSCSKEQRKNVKCL